MGDMLIRDVGDDVIAAWKERARQRGASLQQELRRFVTEHAPLAPAERALTIREFRRLHGMIKADRGPEELIREDRDR